MKIFADKNILAVENNFSRYGELHLFDGRRVVQAELAAADALLVRSITAVNKQLLENTNIQFVGTATSGIDHVDTSYLTEAGIHFADAKGSNANAVVDYCFSALAFATLHKGFELSGSKVGIVGAGAVGGLFAAKLEKLGVEVRCCDPFLAQVEKGGRGYSSLAAVLACDVISLHVPLTRGGAHPTHKLLAAEELASIGRNAVLINACRGGVVDEEALKRLLAVRNDIVTVFDVWAGEPSIDSALTERVDIATPHIAGYSMEAKSNATELLARAFAKHFDLEADSLDTSLLESSNALPLEAAAESRVEWSVLLAALPLIELSEQFKRAVSEGVGLAAFDSLRKQLIERREFKSRLLSVDNFSREQQARLAVLGFRFE